MRIYYATRTGRGSYCHLYGKQRCAHRHKTVVRGVPLDGKGQAPLLLSDKLGAGITTDKSKMNSVISKLGSLQLGKIKKNNVVFDI
jgi:hypothetical protein